MEEGKYIYCIIGENKEKNFGYTGINNREIKLVHYKHIAAVVSKTPVINFDRLDKEELVRYVARHQEVNEKVMKDYDVVPMTFGIIAPSVQEASFKTGLLGMPIKLKLGKLIQKEAEIQKENFIKDIQVSLNSLSQDSTSNKLIDKEMLVNFSFLIEKTRESELDKKMQGLGKKYEGKLRLKYIGPMPPYSFVNINLGLGNFELINEARKLLGLGEEATFEEIKRTYYKLSHRYHPDKIGGDEAKMKKIAQAHRLLENYCQSCDEFSGQGEIPAFAKASAGKQKYSFKKEDVENSIMIT